MASSGKRPPGGRNMKAAAGRYGAKSSKVTMPKPSGGSKPKGASGGKAGY